MATLDEHLAQWRHNRDLLPTLDPAYPDWIVTVTFYAALHAVSGLLLHDGVPARTHAAVNATVRDVRRYQQVRRFYLPLYEKSQDARYSADPAKWVATDQLQRLIIERHLYPLERSVQKLLARDLQLPAVTLQS